MLVFSCLLTLLQGKYRGEVSNFGFITPLCKLPHLRYVKERCDFASLNHANRVLQGYTKMEVKSSAHAFCRNLQETQEVL